MNKPKMTPTRLTVLRAFHQCTYHRNSSSSGFYISPTIREVARFLHKSSTTIFEHIKHLEALGALVATDIKGGCRRYRITDAGKEWLRS